MSLVFAALSLVLAGDLSDFALVCSDWVCAGGDCMASLSTVRLAGRQRLTYLALPLLMLIRMPLNSGFGV